MPRSKSSNNNEMEITPGETLSGKDMVEFMRDCIKIRNDPVWFTEEIFGLNLRPMQEQIMREFYQDKYSPNLKKNKKLVLVCGQRAGKTVLGSAILAYEFTTLLTLPNPAKYYGLIAGKGKGQRIACTCLATSTKQAGDGVFSNMQIFLEGNEWYEQWFDLNFKGSDQRIECEDKNILAQVLAARADTSAGYTNKCVVFDELDLFEKTESKKGADMVYTKLCNSTETFGTEGKIVAISSLQFPDGQMSRVYKDGLDEPNTLALMYKTWEMNPNVTEEYLRAECKYNMARFYRDFANMPEVSSGVQFPEGVTLDKSISNVLEDINYRDNIMRVMSIDPAYKNDSFGVSCGYRLGNKIVIDGVMKFEKIADSTSFIKPSDISNFITGNIQRLNICGFVTDTYMYPEILERVEYIHGIQPTQHIVTKEDYDRWRELQEGLSPVSLRVVYNDFLKRECNSLIVKQTPGGKPKTDHTYSGSKDVSDTVANCIWYLTGNDMELDDVTPVGRVFAF